MDLGQYLSVRKRFSAQRRAMPAEGRLIFDEFAILCELHDRHNASASSIAAAQGISCPTMTHRSNHLCELGLMSREPDSKDRRKLRCALTRKGTSFVHRTCNAIAQGCEESTGIASMDVKDVVKLVARVGTLPMPADDIVLVSYPAFDVSSMTVMQIVDTTGLLQPTVSMAVLRLEKAGCIVRLVAENADEPTVRRSVGCAITDAGLERAARLIESVERL